MASEKIFAAMFHNIRSAYNVGALFRTADGAGVSKLLLTGYTPTPIDRFGRADKTISKTALSAQQYVPWVYEKNVFRAIAQAREEGFSIVGVEQDARAIDYRAYRPSAKTLFIFGNEVRGLSPQLKKQCDALIEIPMHGKKESLNVSVAAGIILYRALER